MVFSELLAVMGVYLLGLISPGADFLVVSKNSLKGSKWSGFLTAIGVSVGLVWHITYCTISIDLLAEIPLVQSVREAADAGRPAVLQGSTPIAQKFLNMSIQIVSAIEKRNVSLPPTSAVEITNEAGCSTK